MFASANEKDKIPKELLSRFAKLHFMEYTSNEFFEVAVRVLTEREKKPASLAAYIAEQTMRTLETKDVRDAVRCQTIKVRRQDVDYLINILSKQKWIFSFLSVQLRVGTYVAGMWVGMAQVLLFMENVIELVVLTIWLADVSPGVRCPGVSIISSWYTRGIWKANHGEGENQIAKDVKSSS